jgi:hypothetical protein
MGRRKRQTPNTATPGVVGPTPVGGSTRRRADQRGAGGGGLVGFGQEHDQAPHDATKTLKPTGFFGEAMPRTMVMEKVAPRGGGAPVAVVEAPADRELAPVTLADIDKGAPGQLYLAI